MVHQVHYIHLCTSLAISYIVYIPRSPSYTRYSLTHSLTHSLVMFAIGAGKKTRVNALLREIFGSGIEKVKLEHRSIKVNSSKTIEITSIGSNYHIECNPSDCGNNDRYVIQEVIKEIASHSNISFNAPVAVSAGSKQFKVVVLTEADRLSKQALTHTLTHSLAHGRINH